MEKGGSTERGGGGMEKGDGVEKGGGGLEKSIGKDPEEGVGSTSVRSMIGGYGANKEEEGAAELDPAPLPTNKLSLMGNFSSFSVFGSLDSTTFFELPALGASTTGAGSTLIISGPVKELLAGGKLRFKFLTLSCGVSLVEAST